MATGVTLFGLAGGRPAGGAGAGAAWPGLLAVLGGAAVGGAAELELVGGAAPLLGALPPVGAGGAGAGVGDTWGPATLVLGAGAGAELGAVLATGGGGAGPGSCLAGRPCTAFTICGGSGCWRDSILYAMIWDLSWISWWLLRLVEPPGGPAGDGPGPGYPPGPPSEVVKDWCNCLADAYLGSPCIPFSSIWLIEFSNFWISDVGLPG